MLGTFYQSCTTFLVSTSPFNLQCFKPGQLIVGALPRKVSDCAATAH